MLDLTMALQWVYDNIYAFNGNKDMITTYGPGKYRKECSSAYVFHLKSGNEMEHGFKNVTIFTFLIKGAGAAAAGLLAITPGSRHMVRQVFGQVSSK